MIVLDKPITWFEEFLGVGYRYHDVYMNVFPLFRIKSYAHKLWKKSIDSWPDDEIKLRFIEKASIYWFIAYCISEYNDDYIGFTKKLQLSENYIRFKNGVEKKAILRFGIYKEKTNTNNEVNIPDLELLKASKSVYDIQFLKLSDLAPGSIERECVERNTGVPHSHQV